MPISLCGCFSQRFPGPFANGPFDGCIDSAALSASCGSGFECVLRVRVWSAIPCGFLVLVAWCGETMLKVTQGQEWDHADELATGPDMPSLLDGRSSWALSNLQLGLCHKRSEPAAQRGSALGRAVAKSALVECSPTLQLTRKICEETCCSMVAAAAEVSLSP